MNHFADAHFASRSPMGDPPDVPPGPGSTLTELELRQLAADPDATLALLNYLAIKLRVLGREPAAVHRWFDELADQCLLRYPACLNTSALVRIAADAKQCGEVRLLALKLLETGNHQTVHLRVDDVAVRLSAFAYLIVQHLISTSQPVDAVRSLELFADLAPPQAIRLVRHAFSVNLMEHGDA